MRFHSLFTALVFGLLLNLSCAVLFWKDTTASSGGTWLGTGQFVEVQTEFERKSSWYALNQNAITRNYQTSLLLHEIKDGAVTKTSVVSHYKGWTLGDSLFLAGSSLIFLRGNSDSVGDTKRELAMVPLSSGEPVLLLKTEPTILSAVPSPDGKLIAVFLTTATNEDRNGKLDVEFYSFTGTKLEKKGASTVQWAGVPGNPELAWARDSKSLYLHVENAVLHLKPGEEPAPAAQFPVCFLATTSGRVISDTGMFFSRTPEGKIQIQKQDESLRFEDVGMTADIKEIGRGCP